MPRTRASRAALLLLALSAGCGGTSDGASRAPVTRFRDVRRVEIAGFAGSAMEPFISCDGRYLLFNNSNAVGERTDLFFAESEGTHRFRFRGELAGANQPGVLDAVPSLDVRGELFFVSIRSYDTTLATLYQGDFRDGRVESVRLVPGNLSRGQRGWLTMDAEVSRDGQSLYFADARFSGAAVPDESDLVVARRTLDTFTVDDESRRIVAALNTRALEYAPATSADGLEIFFTRLEGSTTAILRATRAAALQPFGPPSTVGGIEGFVEAPSLTCDGATLFFHRRDGSEFAIYRAERETTAAASPATVEAASPDPPLQVHTLGSRVFGNTRSLRVRLPSGYFDRANASRRYPVLYLNDGQNLFDAATATFGGGEWQVDEAMERLEAAGRIRPLIVVGIDHAGRRERPREYLPWPDDTLEPPEPDPQGRLYPEFLLREVVPFVESRFRTDGDASLRGLGGSSYGALAAAYTAATAPGAFGRLFLESPSLYVGGGRIFDLFRRWPERLALGVGTNELGRATCTPDEDGGEPVADVRRLAALAGAAGTPPRQVLVTVMPCARHAEAAWAARLDAALSFLYPP